MEDIFLDGRMIMKLILKKQNLRRWNNRTTWLMVGPIGWLL
jgi:hypothetical protein